MFENDDTSDSEDDWRNQVGDTSFYSLTLEGYGYSG